VASGVRGAVLAAPGAVAGAAAEGRHRPRGRQAPGASGRRYCHSRTLCPAKRYFDSLFAELNRTLDVVGGYVDNAKPDFRDDPSELTEGNPGRFWKIRRIGGRFGLRKSRSARVDRLFVCPRHGKGLRRPPYCARALRSVTSCPWTAGNPRGLRPLRRKLALELSRSLFNDPAPVNAPTLARPVQATSHACVTITQLAGRHQHPPVKPLPVRPYTSCLQ